jgi:hypothetical protein
MAPRSGWETTSDSGNSVSVSATGIVRGSSVGVGMIGSGSELINQGQIIGGIDLFGCEGADCVGELASGGDGK